jgi:hypothetical protein
MTAGRVITKADLKKQLQSVKKKNPNATYAELLDINRREQLQPKISAGAAIKKSNAVLQKAGLGTNRGVFMETPLRMVDGKMRYQWGKQIRYSGLGQERSATSFDGEGEFTERFQSDGLLTAIRYAHEHHLWDLPPGYYSHPRAGTYRLGDFALTCAACGAFFSGRKDSKTCSAKCRKRLSRKKIDVTLFETNK